MDTIQEKESVKIIDFNESFFYKIFHQVSPTALDPFVIEMNKIVEPWKCTIRQRNLIIRGAVFGSSLDGVEIPRVLGINSHKAKYCCHLCDLLGSYLGKTYFYRYSENKDHRTAMITREYRNWLLYRLGTREDTLLFQCNSNYVDVLKSWFPMSNTFIDSLHVIYLGIFDTILDNLKIAFKVILFFLIF